MVNRRRWTCRPVQIRSLWSATWKNPWEKNWHLSINQSTSLWAMFKTNSVLYLYTRIERSVAPVQLHIYIVHLSERVFNCHCCMNCNKSLLFFKYALVDYGRICFPFFVRFFSSRTTLHRTVYLLLLLLLSLISTHISNNSIATNRPLDFYQIQFLCD